jgi:polysaccharide export outer membrane protein
MKMAICTIGMALVLGSSAAVLGQEAPSSAPSPSLVDLQKYRIGAEDVLQVAVWKNDAMSRTVPVRPDGMISLPLLNEIRAAGLTPAELRDVLLRKLTEYIPTPEVAVIVVEVRSYKVSVIGEVRKPAQYELKSWSTVLDALAMAGGFTELAARNRIVVLRRGGQRVPFNYNRVVTGEEQSVFLQPGDVILVP